MPRTWCAQLFWPTSLTLAACKCVSVCVCVCENRNQNMLQLGHFQRLFCNSGLKCNLCKLFKTPTGWLCLRLLLLLYLCVCVSLSLYVCVWVCLCFTSFSFYRYFIIIKRISFTFMQLFLHLPHCFSPLSLSLLSLLLVVSYTIRKSERFFRRWMQLFSIYNALNAKWIRRNVKRVCVDRPENTLDRCRESARYTYVTVLSRCHYYYD